MQHHDCDVVILGGGPAGSQCALWLKMLGLDPVIIDVADRLGGLQRVNPYPNNWIVTSPYYKTGEQTSQIIAENLKQKNIDVYLLCEKQSFSQLDDGRFLLEFFSNGSDCNVVGKTLVVATGVRCVTGGFDVAENVIIGSGHVIDHYDFTGKKVAILGGGDSAAENYGMIVAKGASHVKVFARTLRARQNLLASVPSDYIYEGVYNADQASMQVDGKAFDVFCVMYGWKTVNPLPNDILCEMSSEGFFQTDECGRTSRANVFAIGECAGKAHPCVVTAMAEGVQCAKAIQNDFGV